MALPWVGWRVRIVVASMGALILLAVFVASRFSSEPSGSSKEAQAVLPFDIIQGFHNDEYVRNLVASGKYKVGEWFDSARPPQVGQKIVLYVNRTEDWGILKGPIERMEGSRIWAKVSLTTFDTEMDSGPYLVELENQPAMENPWVLVGIERYTDAKK